MFQEVKVILLKKKDKYFQHRNRNKQIQVLGQQPFPIFELKIPWMGIEMTEEIIDMMVEH